MNEFFNNNLDTQIEWLCSNPFVKSHTPLVKPHPRRGEGGLVAKYAMLCTMLALCTVSRDILHWSCICHIYLCLGPGEQVLVPPPLALLQPHHHPALPGPGARALGPAIRASAPRRHCHAQLHHHFGHLGQGLFQVCSHLLRERVKLERKAWSLETVSWYSWVLSTSTAPSIPSRCRMAPGKSR